MTPRILLALLAFTALPALAGTPVSSLPANAVIFDEAQIQRALGGAPLALRLPSGRTATFTTRGETVSGGLVGVRGLSTAGDRLTLFWSGERLHGDVYAAEGHYRLVRHDRGEYWIPQEDHPYEHRLGRDLNVGQDDVLRNVAARQRSDAPPREEPDASGNYVVDLLVVYTPRFEQSLGGRSGAVAEAQRLVFVANTYFENSALPIRYRVLRAEKYTGTQETAGGKRNLKILSHDPAIHAYRDKIGADLVVYLRTLDGRADIAISSLFNGDDKNDPPQDVQPDRDAFLVSYGGVSTAGYTAADQLTAHELGHTFGGGHNYGAHRVDGLYWKPYAHGKDCGQYTPGGRYVSLMSYGELATGQVDGVPIGLPTQNAAQFFETWGDFFSSLALSRDGSTCGADGATEAEQADNVRAMTEAAPYVAAYRKAKTAPLF